MNRFMDLYRRILMQSRISGDEIKSQMLVTRTRIGKLVDRLKELRQEGLTYDESPKVRSVAAQLKNSRSHMEFLRSFNVPEMTDEQDFGKYGDPDPEGNEDAGI